MLDPGKRQLSIVLLAGAALLLLAIAVGKTMGDRVISHATEQGQTGVGTTLMLSPSPGPSDATPFGANWKRTQVLAAAPDPGFPDPRVPPQPLPTPIPTPKPTPTPQFSPTPRPKPAARTPAPNPTFTVAPRPGAPSPGASPTPVPIPTRNLPTPEASPILGPPNPPPQS